MAASRFEPTKELDSRNSKVSEDFVPAEELSRTSTTLMRMARNHDEAGWKELVDVYGLMIYKWCRYGGLSPENASDVCQDVFTAILRNISDFRHDRPGDSFRRWIRAITRNRIRDYWRADKRAERGVGGSAWLERVSGIAATSTEANSAEFSRQGNIKESYQLAIAQVRAEVSNRDWSIVEQLVLEKRRPADVAEELGVSPNTVYLVKSRVLSRLRDCLMSCATMDDPI